VLPLDIHLVEASTADEIERIRLLMKPDEVWRSLAYLSWPERETWSLAFERQERAAFFVTHSSDKVVGFLLNGLKRFKDWGYVEFVVAITDQKYRRKGYGWQTLGLGMEIWFARGASVCWCYYSLSNPGSVGMARAIHSPDMEGGPQLMTCVDGDQPAKAGSFTRAQWEQTKKKIGWV